MDSRRKLTAFALALVAVFMVALIAAIPAPRPVEAAPAAAVTPVAGLNLAPETARVATFFDAESITADTRRCFDLKDFEMMDIQYVIDVTASQTITLKIQHSNDNATFSDGATVANAVTADGDAITQQALFGRYNCIYADVTTANAVVVTAIGIAK